MKRKRKGLTDPAYEIIQLLRTKGLKAKLLPPDDESMNDPRTNEILKKIINNHSKKDPK